jgi:hypothetical protein
MPCAPGWGAGWAQVGVTAADISGMARFILGFALLLSTLQSTAQSFVPVKHALPENPRPQPERAGFWTFGSPDAPAPLRSNREVFHDRTWLATQSFWLGTIVYDSELTHQGLAHHNCVEGSQIGPHPSRGALYRSDLPEYVVGTAFNYLALRFLAKPLIFEFAAYGSVEHLRGGTAWLLNCW